MRRDPPIYLLHGLMGTSYAHFGEAIRRWEPLRKVIPIDLPGHGRSAHAASTPYYELCTTVLMSELQRHGPGDVVGASYLGGAVALRCAIASPALMQTLVVTGYVPSAPPLAMCQWARAFVHLVDAHPPVADCYRQLHGAGWRVTLNVAVEEVIGTYEGGIAVCPGQLQGLRVPTLLVNGLLKELERDAVRHLSGRFKCLETAGVAGAGHLPSVDRPQVFNQLVENFWRRNDERCSEPH